MFIGSINTDVRAVLAERAHSWFGRPVYVGCSGNFTVERILHTLGVGPIHGNDVSLYSCAVGAHLSGRPFRLGIKSPGYEWLSPYLEPGPGRIATLLLCLEMLQYDRQGKPAPPVADWKAKKDALYGRRWRDARAAFLAAHPDCAECARADRKAAATQVDHVVAHKGDEALFWDLANWQPLCDACHAHKTAVEDQGGDAGTAYHRRMLTAYRRHWEKLHAGTVAKVTKALGGLKLAEFYAGDVMDFVRQAPPEAAVVSFPPTYCLAPDERILTADLRWVRCGDLRAGDRLLSFDEDNGSTSRRRRWRTVTRSEPALAECVRVHLQGGKSVVCSADHPWLSDHGHSGPTRKWRRADSLTGLFALKVFDTWESATSFNAGWVSGIIDGEGSLNVAPEAATLTIAQKEGAVASTIKDRLAAEGFEAQRHQRHGDKMTSTVVGGGFREVLRAVGRLRPIRLLEKFQRYDISCRAVHAEGVKVEAVEPLGQREIQSITVDCGTYVGEGYLMHNTKGYEKLYRKLDEVLDWDRPYYQVFDAARFDEFTRLLVDRPHWMTLRDGPCEALAQHLTAVVQTSPRARPVHVYSPAGKARLTRPAVRIDPVAVPRLQELPQGSLTLARLSQAQLDALRSQYLGKNIVPSAGQLSLAVLAGGKLAGALSFALSPREWVDVYLLSDFAVDAPVPRLSKLIAAVALSVEVRALLEQQYRQRVLAIGTTAFTDKPVSMKYRGVFELHSRKPGMLNYKAAAGRWTLQEVLTWWRGKNEPVNEAVKGP